MSSALITSRATESRLPKPSARPSSTLFSPLQIRPLNMSGVSFSRFPRPSRTTPMNCRWISSISCLAYCLRSEEHTSELQSLAYLVCRLLLEKKKKRSINSHTYLESLGPHSYDGHSLLA